jgi:hypothetical protein
MDASLLQAGAAEKNVPLYKHIADLAGNKKLVRVQRPMALARQCSGSAAGFAEARGRCL